MRVAQLFPSSTGSSANIQVNPGVSTAHAALADNDDGSSVDFQPSAADWNGEVGDLTLSAGEQVYKVQGVIRFRTLTAGGKSWIRLQMIIAGTVYEFWSTPSGFEQTDPVREQVGTNEFLGKPDGSAFTDANMDAANLRIITQNVFSPITDVRVYRARLDVTIAAQPTINVTGPTGVNTNPQPTIAWTFAGDGTLTQTYYIIRVFTAAQVAAGGFNIDTTPPVWQTNEVPSAAHSKEIGTPLADGNYVAYVAAAQGRKHYSAWDSVAFTIAHGPNQPTVVSPNSGSVLDASGGITLDWAYTHPSNVAQASWAIRRQVDDGVAQYWRTSDNTWQPAIVYNAGNVTEEAFPAGAFPVGHTYKWAVAVGDANGLSSPWSQDSIFTSAGPPSVNITAPAGTVTTTTRPTVTWTFTDGAGRPEATYRVKIFPRSITLLGGFDPDTSSGAVVDSGTRAGPATSFPTTYDFPPDNTQFVAYVKVSAGGQSSTWDSQQFGVNVAAPAAPSGVTATENTTVNGVDIVVSGSAGGGFTGVTTIVERSLDGGATWEVVRFSSGNTVTDYEVPGRKSVQYRAKFRGTSSGITVTGPASSATSVATAPAAWWLRDVHDVTLRTAIPPNEGLRIDHPLGVGVFDTVGQPEEDGASTTVSEPTPRGARFTLEVWIKTGSVKSAVDAILRPGRTLLLQDVLDQQWYVEITGDGVSWEFLRSPHATMPREHAYKYAIPFVVVGRPAVS